MRFPRSRLAFRIYLAGVAQVLAVLAAFFALTQINRAVDQSRERDASAAVSAVVATIDDPVALEHELARARESLGAPMVIYDGDGRVVASSLRRGVPPPPPPPLFPDHPPPFPPPALGPPPPPAPGPNGPVRAFVIPVWVHGELGTALVLPPAPGGVPTFQLALVGAVMIVLAVASWLLARSLARPLARVSATARAFGEGKLDARTGVDRADEIGEVARAFDDMAGHVADLVRAEKELLANVSHELRTPLARVRVALDIATEGDPASAHEALAGIGEDLSELDRLMSDVLVAARLDLADASPSGAPPLRKERVSLAALLNRAASRFQSMHDDRELVVELAADLGEIDGDPVLVRRVVDNLLANAHAYSPDAASCIELRAARADGGVRVEVEDHGLGISAEDLANVFRPFFRADKSRTRATGGLGLGLALARRIVEAHGGTLRLTSVPGEGTTATIALPSAEDDA